MTHEKDKARPGPGPLHARREQPGPVPPDKGSADGEQPARNEAPSPGADTEDVAQQKTPRRLWSTRRIPAALAAAVVLVVAGFLLFDVVWARTGHSAVGSRGPADELATRPLDDVWMLTGAAVAAALGLWLIVLALTPGLRHLLPLRPHDDGARMRAALDRDGAAQLLRDTAMRVPGVGRARVRVRRRRITMRADVRFRDPHEVENDLIASARDDERNRLSLARPPRLKVRARPHT
ncbi:DUF6286 domain-containing protein [Streptomyces sp. NPDC001922]|uniref:DUF6286 domain-containing protein n=1 Tax=Streptomyces sp. NPDC001922 TaxID=3364624 RepID=UPI003675B94D